MIRRLCPADRVDYLSMAKAFYASRAVSHPIPEIYFERTFDELMRSDVYAEGYLIVQDGAPAGYALLAKTFSQEAGGLCIWVDELYVRPAYRDAGLGSAFFALLEKRFGGTAKRLRLEVSADNHRAAALYRRKGFTDLPYVQMVRDAGE